MIDTQRHGLFETGMSMWRVSGNIRAGLFRVTTKSGNMKKIGHAACAVLFFFILQSAAAGLGGEYVISDKWRAAHAEISAYSNPALLVARDHFSLRYAGSRTMEEFALHELGITLPLGLYQSVGVSWLYQGTGDYARTDAGGIETGTISDRNNLWTLTYAVNPWRRLYLGVNVNVASQQFADDRETGFGIDAGVAVPFLNTPVLGRHTIGVAMQNLVAPRIGSGYAGALSVGWSGEVAERRVSLGSEFKLRDPGGAAEWGVDSYLGLYLLKFLRIRALLGFKEAGIDHYGGVAGVNVPAANQGRDLCVMYQYIVLENGQGAHSVYFNLELGRNREELLARSVAVRLNTAPADAYDRALSLFWQKRYWEAYLAMGTVKVEYPDFFQMDQVDYYMARCLEELDMLDAAEKSFERVGVTNVKSAVLPEVYLGLMRVYYRRKNESMAHALFNTIINTGCPDSIRHHAFYLMGQINFEQQRWPQAMELFRLIGTAHPMYPFAIYSSAVIAGIQGNHQAMRDFLVNVMTTTPRDRAQEEIGHKSLVMLGYLLLETFQKEEKSLAQAVAVLRRVPKSSLYYPDALLGMGWAAIRAGVWNDGLAAGAELLKSGGADPLLRAEGALIAGYAHAMRREYDNAVKMLQEGIALARMPQQPPGPGDDIRQAYAGIASTLVDVAGMRRIPQVSARIDSLRKEFTTVKRALDAHADLELKNRRHAFFTRRHEILLSDLEFMHARILNRSAGAKAERLRDQSIQKQQQIDDEIQRLKEQMHQLE